MNDVAARQLESYRLAYWDVDFICRDYRHRRIAIDVVNFPPPAMTDDPNRRCRIVTRSRRRVERA
jgi:hypothetical protein